MAVSNEMLAGLASLAIIYWLFFNNRTRWIRMVGAVLIVVVAGVFGMVADNATMYVLFLVNLLVGTLKLVSLTSTVVFNTKEWF